ncbi:hypothetical protein Q3G72_005195 [Acer saccharum]|nr:hypothetical protein Q3G72_005195 [Acer saccharum]
MTWSGSNETEDWLSRSAVGELETFSNVNSVNQKLEARGFIFSSSFLGGKRIVWTFESELDRDGFLYNRFFWKDSFLNMSKWRDSMLSSSRLRWVDAYGVPLQCWCKPFFTKLGGQVGEAVWIEESTVAKRVLDKGRVLIIAPLEVKISCTIDLKIGKLTFPVILVEDPMPVSSSWVTEFLGLKSAISNLNLLPTKEGVDHPRPSDRREWFSEEESGYDCDSREEMTTSFREKEETRKTTAGRSKEKVVRNALIRKPKSDWKVVGGAKGGWIQKPRFKSSYPICTGSIKLDKVRKSGLLASREGEVSSSLDTDFVTGDFSKHSLVHGECSKLGLKSKPMSGGPKDQVGSGSSKSGPLERTKCTSRLSDSNHESGPKVCLQRASRAGGVMENQFVDETNPEDGEILGYRQEMLEEGPEKEFLEGNRGLDLIVDLCEKVNGDSSRNVEGDILQQDEKSYNLEQEIIGERKKQHLQEESEKCGSVGKFFCWFGCSSLFQL